MHVHPEHVEIGFGWLMVAQNARVCAPVDVYMHGRLQCRGDETQQRAGAVVSVSTLCWVRFCSGAASAAAAACLCRTHYT